MVPVMGKFDAEIGGRSCDHDAPLEADAVAFDIPTKLWLNHFDMNRERTRQRIYGAVFESLLRFPPRNNVARIGSFLSVLGAKGQGRIHLLATGIQLLRGAYQIDTLLNDAVVARVTPMPTGILDTHCVTRNAGEKHAHVALVGEVHCGAGTYRV